MAYRKLGTLMPMVATNITRFSTHLRLVKAATMPRVTPTVMAMMKATRPSFIVAGRHRAMMVVTAVPFRVMESPKSPVMAFCR